MKANKKTLIAIKKYLTNSEGYNMNEVISDLVQETKLLKTENDGFLIAPDECVIYWGSQEDGDEICCLQDFIDTFSERMINSICNVIDSFMGEDIDCYLEDEE